MKENEDKYIEQFVDKVMKETPLESPSPGFTAKVMANVWATLTVRLPFISPSFQRRGWLIIFGSIIAAIAYLL